MNKNDVEVESEHKILIKKAISIMKQVEDPKHSLSHVLQVVAYTKEILKSLDANAEVCLIAAYWHDVGRIKQEKGHALMSRRNVERRDGKVAIFRRHD